MKRLFHITFLIILSHLSMGQIRNSKSRYIELSASLRDGSTDFKENHQYCLSFVSPSKIKVYKRFNIIYDSYNFNLLKLNQIVPIERYIGTFTIEKPFVHSSSNRAYIGFEIGGGFGYEQINKGAEIINNFQINTVSSAIGAIQFGLNAELYLSRGFAIGIRNALYFSPNSAIQRVTTANGVMLKLKIKNTK